MKNLLLLITLFLCSIIANATTYYVATTGSDSNPGTLAAPFRSWDKLSGIMVAGDIAYIRGGTYASPHANSASVHCYFDGMIGTAANPIKIWAYPGEVPVLNLGNITPGTYADPIGMYLSGCQYLHIKGLQITYLKQIADGSGISRGITLGNSQHCTIEQVDVSNIGGPGFTIENQSNDNLILNTDSHHNGDGMSSRPWDNSDGFDCSTGGDMSTRNVFRGCRSYLNGDDGFDTFNSNALVTYDNCWSFWNGVRPWGTSNMQVTPSAMTASDYSWHGNSAYYSASGASGEGFKLGVAASQNFNLLTRVLTNCIGFQNRGTGFASNSLSAVTCKHQLYNCVAYGNDNDGFSYGAGWSAGATQTFKNCWAWSNNQASAGADWVYDGNNSANISNNIWMSTYGGVNYGNLSASASISNADFLSTSSAGVAGARQSDGSLPNLNFLKLSSTSKLINKGVNVGLAYVSSAPDIGAFESTGTATNALPTANAGADIILTLPTNSATLTGSATDPDGSIASYGWTKVSGSAAATIGTTNAASTTITGLTQGTYQFQLTVTDNSGGTATDILIVVVNAPLANTAPSANAGADKTTTLPTDSVTMTGAGTDADGTISAYLWTKVSGPSTGGNLSASAAATTKATKLAVGVYKFELRVTDNAGGYARDTVQITVIAAGNTAPVANAGADKTMTLPTSTTSFAGSGTDANGTIASYAWTKVSGPTGGTILTAAAASTTITALAQGVYKFELKVTDNGGATGRDTVQVTVDAVAAPNNAYGGTRWAIPGKIEAENFDLGGQNVAYYDNTNGNNGGVYRKADYVDIENSTEGSPNVGWITAGEWMKYSVNVATAGKYSIAARVATGAAGKSFTIEMDGTTIATITVPNTGSSQAWQTVTVSNINLTAGAKTMRIYATTAGFNINYVQYTLTAATATRMATDSSALESDTQTTVTTFPLPFSTSFTASLYGQTKGDYNLTLVDVSGKAVWQKTVNKTTETVTENIYMGNLADGVYVLQVVSPDGKKSTQTLIKN